MPENSDKPQTLLDRILQRGAERQNTQIANEIIPEPLANVLAALGIGQETLGSGVSAIIDSLTGANQEEAAPGEEAIDPFEFDPAGRIELIMGLAKLMNNRRAQGDPGRDISDILDRIAAPGQKFNAGFNPGGLADFFAGLISGEGTAATMNSGFIPDEIRRANVVPVEQLVVGQTDPEADPGLGADLAAGEDLLATLLGQPTRAQKAQDQLISSIKSRGPQPAPQFTNQTAIGL